MKAGSRTTAHSMRYDAAHSESHLISWALPRRIHCFPRISSDAVSLPPGIVQEGPEMGAEFEKTSPHDLPADASSSPRR